MLFLFLIRRTFIDVFSITTTAVSTKPSPSEDKLTQDIHQQPTECCGVGQKTVARERNSSSAPLSCDEITTLAE